MLKTFTYLSASISYRKIGQGRPMILLHGFGEDGHIWDEQVLFLKDDCLLIIPDLPGSGASSLLTGETISIDDYADCIYALLQQENIAECTMIGHSMGGYITLAFAEKYPSLLSGFGLVHSTAFADSEEKKLTRQKGIDFMEKNGGYAFLKTSIPNLFAPRFKENHPEKVDALIEASARFSTEALQQYYRAMMLRPERTAVLKSNPLPVFFVMGNKDSAVPIIDVLQQVNLPNISYIHVLADVGHMGMWEEPGLLNRFLLDFINR
jgi:pimeloyl-ACP methyl ester carboxylesterase